MKIEYKIFTSSEIYPELFGLEVDKENMEKVVKKIANFFEEKNYELVQIIINEGLIIAKKL